MVAFFTSSWFRSARSLAAYYTSRLAVPCVLAIATAGLAPVSLKAQDHAALAEVGEPAGYRDDHYRSPVPKTLKGARVVDAAAAAELAKAGAVMIDVYPQAPKPAGLPPGTIWRRPKHMSIDGATWLPNVGYGKLAQEPETYFRYSLERLSGGAKDKPLVFYCLRDCWMSWNAAKRALEWGYADVIWFPDGTDGWQENGGTLVEATPAPGADGKVQE